jgi:hypothetical protein
MFFKAVTYATITLVDAGRLEGAAPDQVDGRQITDTIAPWLAARSSPLARGNRTKRFPLTVPRYFDTAELAAIFLLEHYDDLPDTGQLSFTCGAPGDTSTRVADAVLESCVCAFAPGSPTTVIVDYMFLIGEVS